VKKAGAIMVAEEVSPCKTTIELRIAVSSVCSLRDNNRGTCPFICFGKDDLLHCSSTVEPYNEYVNKRYNFINKREN
jgi:hypothetical protein